MKPGETDSCTFTITMLDDELEMHLEIETLMDTTATINIQDVVVTSLGRNIGGATDIAVEDAFTLTSADDSSQNNLAVLDLIAENTCKCTRKEIFKMQCVPFRVSTVMMCPKSMGLNSTSNSLYAVEYKFHSCLD